MHRRPVQSGQFRFEDQGRFKLAAVCSLIFFWFILAPIGSSSLAAGPFTIFDTSPITGGSHIPVDLALADGHGITFFYQVPSLLPCQPVAASISQRTVNFDSAEDTGSYSFTSVEFDPTSTSIRWFRLKDLNLIELLPDTTYHVTLSGGTDGVAVKCGDDQAQTTYYLANDFQTSFTTGPDTLPPKVSIHQTDYDGTVANISWQTDQASDSQVLYGPNPMLGLQTSIDNQLVFDHHMTLTGLSPGTTYYFQIHSRDRSGNLGTATGRLSTLLVDDIDIEHISGHQVTISWNTNHPATSLVDYGPTPELGGQAGDTTLRQRHHVTLASLQPASQYHFRIKSATALAEASSEAQTFITRDAWWSAPDEPTPAVLAATDDRTGIGQPVSGWQRWFQPTILGLPGWMVVSVGLVAGLCLVLGGLLYRHHRHSSPSGIGSG